MLNSRQDALQAATGTYTSYATSMMIIIVGASLSEQHTDLHTAGFVMCMHK